MFLWRLSKYSSERIHCCCWVCRTFIGNSGGGRALGEWRRCAPWVLAKQYCWKNRLDKRNLLPTMGATFPSFLSLSLSCSCTIYSSFSLSILHSLLSHSRYPAEILALNLNWHSAIYHRFRRGHTWFSDHQPLSSPRLFSPLCSPSSSTRQFWFSASEFSMHDQGSRHSTPRCCRLHCRSSMGMTSQRN